MNKSFDKAVRILKNGGIVIFPTDTAFGIGCRIDNAKAVRKLFKLRKRPSGKAVPVLVSSIKMVEKYVEKIDPDVRSLMQKYWPGGLTIVLKCKKGKISNLVRGGGDTIGVRIPAHQTVRELIKKIGVPILGPSANFAEGKTPFLMSDLDSGLVRKVDFVLHGRCKIKESSTVLDVVKKPWRVIREGAVRLES